MKIKKILILIMCLGLFSTSIMAASLEEATEFLKEIDEYSNFEGQSFSSTISLISEDPEDGIEKTVIYQFREDATDKFLILIKEPTIKKGQGYLKIDDNLWFYDPESRKFSFTSLSDQFNSSDANNSDFASSSLIEDYKVISVEEGELGKFACFILELEALNNEVTYPMQKVWISEDKHLVLKKEEYSKSLKLMRSSYFLKYKKVGDNLISTKSIFQDELVEGKKTTITLTNVSTKIIPDSVFTKSYVERVNN